MVEIRPGRRARPTLRAARRLLPGSLAAAVLFSIAVGGPASAQPAPDAAQQAVSGDARLTPDVAGLARRWGAQPLPGRPEPGVTAPR